MKDPSEFTTEELETIRKRLRGKRLVSRANWAVRQVAYVLACGAAFAAVIYFFEGTWQIIGLVVVALIASGIPEVLVDWRYGNYRQEWELANGPDPETEGVQPTN